MERLNDQIAEVTKQQDEFSLTLEEDKEKFELQDKYRDEYNLL